MIDDRIRYGFLLVISMHESPVIAMLLHTCGLSRNSEASVQNP